MSNWITKPVSDCVEAIVDYRGKTPPKSPSGIPTLTAANVKNGRIDLSSVSYVSPETYRAWTTRGFPEPGDVLITTEAPVGEVAPFPGDRTYLITRRLMALRAKRGEVDSRFLLYALLNPAKHAELLRGARGSTVPRVLKTDITSLPLSLPDLCEQRQIASVLHDIDQKIDLNRRMNETLEAMAQAIFKDWFVDFGPVRRKMAGLTDPLDIMGSLAPDSAEHLAALFPGALGDNELPVGWEAATVNYLIELNPKEALKRGTAAPYTEMASLPTSGSSASEPVEREFTSGMRFRNGDALLARITPCLENGKAAFVDFLPDEETIGWGSTEFIVLRARKPIPAPFSYLLVRHPSFRETAVQSMTGTSGRQRAQADTLKNFEISKAGETVYAAFGDLVVPLFAMIAGNASQNQTLAAIRDLLLPKLMSGEIRLSEAERIVEDVA